MAGDGSLTWVKGNVFPPSLRFRLHCVPTRRIGAAGRAACYVLRILSLGFGQDEQDELLRFEISDISGISDLKMRRKASGASGNVRICSLMFGYVRICSDIFA